MVSWKKQQEQERKTIEWLQEYVKIEEIDDVRFREALFLALTTQNKARRFEIHNSDLVYCLRASWAHKVLPEEYTEDKYSMLFHWLRGKGIEIGVVNALASLLESLGKSEDIDLQKVVKIGESVGHVDLQLFDIPYEIFTRLFYGTRNKPKEFPPSDKIIQDISYMVAQDKIAGRVKLYVMVPPTTFKITSMGPMEVKKKERKTERTWQLTLSKEGFDYFKKLFEGRAEFFSETLNNGRWESLPFAFFKWRCTNCKICEHMRTHKNEVKIAWLKWRKERDEFRRRNLQVLQKA